MPWNDVSKSVEALWAFVNQFAPGETADRSDFDAYLSDLISAVNSSIRYTEALAVFQPLYLGSQTTAPTEQQDTTPLEAGNFYFDLPNICFMVWDGTQWNPATGYAKPDDWVISNFLGSSSATQARSALELGTAATADADSFAANSQVVTSLSALNTVADRIFYTTAPGVVAQAVLTEQARTLLSMSTVQEQRDALGLGSAALKDIGFQPGNVLELTVNGTIPSVGAALINIWDDTGERDLTAGGANNLTEQDFINFPTNVDEFIFLFNEVSIGAGSDNVGLQFMTGGVVQDTGYASTSRGSSLDVTRTDSFVVLASNQATFSGFMRVYKIPETTYFVAEHTFNGVSGGGRLNLLGICDGLRFKTLNSKVFIGGTWRVRYRFG